MDEKDLLQHKQALGQRKKELEETVQDHFGLDEEFSQEVTGELSNYDNHPGDHGTELFERSKDIALNEHAEKELEDVKEALARADEGSYGVCAVCGVEIPFERLEAVPTTDRCIEHAKEDTTNRERPVEEEVMDPDIRSRENREVERVGYDAEDAWQEVNRYGFSDSPSDFYGDRESFDEMYPNYKENTDGPEDVESYIASDDSGQYDEETLNYYRSRNN